MSKQERRFLTQPIEVNAVDGSAPKIVGYAARFSPSRSEDLGHFFEELDPHCFDECLADENHEILGLFNHNSDMPLGRRSAGTMRVSVDAVGLKYEIDPPDTTVARDLMVSLKRGDIKSSSFGFFCLDDSFREDPKTGDVIRTIHKASIFDCSPVVFPAYSDTTSQVRSLFPDAKGEVPAEITTKIAETRAKQKAERRYHNVLSAVAGTKWAILPEKLETICSLLNARAEGISATKEEIRAAMLMGEHEEVESKPTVAVIPVYGTIAQRMGMFDEFSGGTSCEQISKSFKEALADEGVTRIVLDIDSPGGTVTGVPELAAEILAARGQKPIIAVSNGMAASAAYWIASACDKIVVTPSGEVGSIGVYMTHQDVSAALDKAGVKMTFIQAGKYKTDGNSYEPLSDSARTDMQDGVDKFYDMFTMGVAVGRGVSQDTVKADFGQGRMLLAKDAVAAGMADEIATLDQVLAGFSAVNELPEVVGSATSDIEVSAVAPTVATNMDGCDCHCPECEDDDCENCSNDTCDDPDCEDCPNQDSEEMKAARLASKAATAYRVCKLKLASR